MRARRSGAPDDARRGSARERAGVDNARIAATLRRIADFLELERAGPFRVRAYRSAARSVDLQHTSVALMALEDPASLMKIPGIGRQIASVVAEIASTGSTGLLRALESRFPPAALDLMRIPGVGAERALAICDSLGVRTPDELMRAVQRGELRAVQGIGPVREQRVRTALQHGNGEPVPHLLGEALERADSLLRYLHGFDAVEHAEAAGTIRRRRPVVDEIGIVASSWHRDAVLEHFQLYPGALRAERTGARSAAVRLGGGSLATVHVVSPDVLGACLIVHTGSAAHVDDLLRMSHVRGMSLQSDGLHFNGQALPTPDEAAVYSRLGLEWIPPELREGRGEIDSAREGMLPRLLELADIRGDLQSHSSGSDGRASVEEMALAAEELGYEYLAITDHTHSLRIAGGMNSAEFRDQMRMIDSVNARLRRLRVLKGAEVEIHRDGSLDLDRDTLRELDIVLVSVHSAFRLERREQTRRVVRALSHDNVDVYAHPLGQRLGRRAPIDVDWGEICRVAADCGVMIEMNAQPERSDIHDEGARQAIEAGVLLTIGSDAHRTAELGLMRFGVWQARRAWATPEVIANTRTLDGLLALLHAAR